MALTPEVSAITGLGSGEVLVWAWDAIARPYALKHGVEWFPEISKYVAIAIAPTLMLIIHQIWGDWRTVVDSRLDRLRTREFNNVDIP